MDTGTIVKNGASGAVSGLAAALVMNLFQSGWSMASSRLGSQGDDDANEDEPSTVKAADRVAQATTSRRVPDDRRQLAGQAVHYGFGALLGAMYGAAATVYPAIRTGYGAPFGAAVWAVADEALVPAAGLSQPASKVPASTHAYSLASHLLFGAALEGGQRLLQLGLAKVGNSRARQTG